VTLTRNIGIQSQHLSLYVMLLAVMASAISVVYTKHQSRVEFVALLKLEQHRDDLDEEWGRLLLEQSTWASPGRVEHQAKIKLDMIIPMARSTVVLNP
jgi:cell division protein FtsL